MMKDVCRVSHVETNQVVLLERNNECRINVIAMRLYGRLLPPAWFPLNPCFSSNR